MSRSWNRLPGPCRPAPCRDSVTLIYRHSIYVNVLLPSPAPANGGSCPITLHHWSPRVSESLAASRRSGRLSDAHLHLQPTRSTLMRIHRDRKSTRLNSSHVKISYAVFCLKKKKQRNIK